MWPQNNCLLGVSVFGRYQNKMAPTDSALFRRSGDFNVASLLAFQWREYFNKATSPLPSRGPAL